MAEPWHSHGSHTLKRKPHGFTLIEVLVTITLIAALVVASAVGIHSARRQAKCVVEINAARNLIAAYLSHAADHGGRVLPGYQADAGVTNIEGGALHYPINARYPWRLAPSVPKIEGVMLFNGNESALKEENRDFLVSVHPVLGLNATLVGGHFGTGSPLPPSPRLLEAFGKFVLTHLSESSVPEKLLVFASARSGENEPGYFEVRPPNLLGGKLPFPTVGDLAPEAGVAQSLGFSPPRRFHDAGVRLSWPKLPVGMILAASRSSHMPRFSTKPNSRGTRNGDGWCWGRNGGQGFNRISLRKRMAL